MTLVTTFTGSLESE